MEKKWLVIQVVERKHENRVEKRKIDMLHYILNECVVKHGK